METGTATIVINRPPNEVFAAVSDISRTGEWSPECIAGRWVGDATGPAVGARFEGDNAVAIAGRTVKRWTTTSVVTACQPDAVFEFVAEEYTTWRYELMPDGAGTRLTETFAYEPKGVQGFVYTTLLRRSRGMTKGMDRTLARLKSALESP